MLDTVSDLLYRLGEKTPGPENVAPEETKEARDSVILFSQHTKAQISQS